MNRFLAATTGIILLASPAFADDIGWEHRSQENTDYFKHAEHVKTLSTPSAPLHSTYDFSTDRSARITDENTDYFKRVGDHGPAIKTFNKFSDKSEYPFPHSRLNTQEHAYTYIGAEK